MLTLNFALFGLYLLLNVFIGLAVARRHTANAREYFLAGEGLPWYAIGGSIIAANISTEHFIGMVGIAYAVGFVVAQWEWGNVITFSALIWIFLPFYIRGGLYTMSFWSAVTTRIAGISSPSAASCSGSSRKWQW